jgi:hypothetical protein
MNGGPYIGGQIVSVLPQKGVGGQNIISILPKVRYGFTYRTTYHLFETL